MLCVVVCPPLLDRRERLATSPAKNRWGNLVKKEPSRKKPKDVAGVRVTGKQEPSQELGTSSG